MWIKKNTNISRMTARKLILNSLFQEIVAALQSGCNIIPILDNFQWPDPEELPEDMRAVCYFNGVRCVSLSIPSVWTYDEEMALL